MRVVVRIQAEPIDVAAFSPTAGDGDAGAIVTFAGVCRSEDGTLAALDLEHYPAMAEAELKRIAEEAGKRWPLEAITVVHRHGRVRPGETIVFVATVARHRRPAFDAAAFVMDYLKTSAPFWKKERTADGDERWVAARAEDDADAARWEAAGQPTSSTPANQ